MNARQLSETRSIQKRAGRYYSHTSWSCFSGGSQGSVRKSLFLQGKVEASAYDRDRLGLSLQLVDIACVKTMPTAVQCRVCGVSGRKLFDPDIHSEILLASRE